ncbi:MAG: glycosyltransferase family 4 protein [Rhodocyclaceae bacterium]|nr:glycosyltransferase family 4 protein [Rhodocyclaceae bacterium]MBX3667275.1 glycosyltransferase family 4 protein [Rhodocyclaceae bacterium]
MNFARASASVTLGSCTLLYAYPQSREFLLALREAVGCDFEQMALADLRQSGLLGMLRTLRRMRPDCLLLPLEDENSVALLPILKLLAGATCARRIAVIGPDLVMRNLSRVTILADAMRFGLASLGCLLAALGAHKELTRLLHLRRPDVHVAAGARGVLYLKTNLWFGIKAGGSVGHIAGVVNGLQGAGFNVNFASAEAPVMVDPGVEICRVPPPATFGLPFELNNYRFQREFARTTLSELARPGYAFIYQRLSVANYLGVLLSRAQRLPLVVEYNGSEVWVARNWGRRLKHEKLADMSEQAMLRHAHLVVTISAVLKEELIARGVAAERIVCYPNCIDPAVFDPARYGQAERAVLRSRYDIAPDSIVVAFIGTFGQWHGAERLAQAIALLYAGERDWIAQNKVHFMLVGDGLKMPEVRTIIESAGAGAICTLTGLVAQQQAPLHLAAADILVSPHVPNSDGSRFFGSPTKLFEYMAMGKAILASDLDQIGEVLSPGLRVAALPGKAPADDCADLAVLATPGDVAELVSGIRFLVERPDWRARLGANARACALARYTWSHHVEAILTGLARVCAPPPGAFARAAEPTPGVTDVERGEM